MIALEVPTDSARVASGTVANPALQARRSLEGILGVPATEGNRIDILRNGDEIFPAMLDAIGGATTTVDLLTFIYWKGEVGTAFSKALCERARAGVRVRVLLDGWGAHPIERRLVDEMESAGVRIRWFRPLRRFHPTRLNHRTHRKVLIVDESIGFTGGVGISDLWRGDARSPDEWRDTHFRVVGPAVDGLRSAFLDNWLETDPVLFEPEYDRFPEQPKAGGSIVQCVRGASETGSSDVSTLFRSLLELAQHEIRIATAYFVPDDDLTERLCKAASRGVRIQLLLPGPYADKRFVQLSSEVRYAPLLDCGIEVWTFQPSMFHTKVMTVDGIIANIGSANLNSRSLSNDEEINLVAIDADLTSALNGQFDADLGRSIEIDPSLWANRSMRQRFAERLTAPLRRIS